MFVSFPVSCHQISGLPGGIDYFVLGLIKVGISDKMTQKRLSSNLNVWVRAPGILSATFILYQSVLYGLVAAPWWTIALQLTLPAYNALYYSKQSVANYSVHYMLERLGHGALLNNVKQRMSVTIGTEIMDWDEAIATVLPQKDKDFQNVARGGS